MRMFIILLIAGIVTGLTLIIRVPIPGTQGYLNMGDMAVVFSGLYLGKKDGALAAGLGSAAADMLGGFFVFAPITFIAKGLEGYIVGALGRKNILWIFTGGIMMLAVYFFAEIIMPGIGYTAALSELPFNLIQAIIGAFGGSAIYKGVKTALPAVGDN